MDMLCDLLDVRRAAIAANLFWSAGISPHPAEAVPDERAQEKSDRMRGVTVGGMEQVLGFSIDADGGERLRFSDAEFTVRVSASSTHGAFTVIEEANPLDTPLHVHKNEDELWYVLEGEHVIQVGDDEFRVGPGGIVFGPRGVPHAQRRIVPRTGRILEFFSPAGFDGFFRELSEAETSGASMPEAYARVSEKYGITWL